ncbi:MAG: hypothetical protein AAF843_03740 [Bacteroidota bacterium]
MKKMLTFVMLIITTNCLAQELQLPNQVKEFLYNNSEYPAGKLNDRAPKGLEQFGWLTGVWEMTSNAYFQGKWFSGWPSYWAWKYAVDGMVIQDFFYHPKENFPPQMKQDFDTFAFNLRVYDEESDRWTVTWIANSGGEHRFVAEKKGNEVWMTPVNTGEQKSRIIFSDITPDSFKWRNESQNEAGEWEYNHYLTGKRIL